MKFTIRDLFLVTVIVALALGWWVDRPRLVEQHRPYEDQEEFERYYLEYVRDSLASTPKQPKP